MTARVAFVTAGAQGIGRAISTALVRDGWTVAALDVDAEALEDLAAELGRGLLALEGDAGAEEVIAGCIGHIVEQFGDFEFFVMGHGGAGRLFAVTQGGVENQHLISHFCISLYALASGGAYPL